MNYANITLKIVKLLRVYFILCLFVGTIASIVIDIEFTIVAVFIFFCLVLIIVMTKLINHFDRRFDQIDKK